jgi:hypothetical protein
MRTAQPAINADDAFQLSSLSDSAFLSADANNTTNQYPVCALYYGGAAAANIAVKMAQGGIVTIKNVQPGTFLPVAVTQVRSTNSTAAAADILCVVSRNRA